MFFHASSPLIGGLSERDRYPLIMSPALGLYRVVQMANAGQWRICSTRQDENRSLSHAPIFFSSDDSNRTDRRSFDNPFNDYDHQLSSHKIFFNLLKITQIANIA